MTHTTKPMPAEDIVALCREFHDWLAERSGLPLVMTSIVRNEDTVYVIGKELDLDVLQSVIDGYSDMGLPAASQSVH